MKKILISAILAVICLFCYSQTYVVDPSDPTNYNTIQSAVNAAGMIGGEAEIVVNNPNTNGQPFTYTESISINFSTYTTLNSLVLIKDTGDDEVIISSPSYTQNTISVTGSSNVASLIIEGFTISNGNYGVIFEDMFCYTTYISKCTITNNYNGLMADDTTPHLSYCKISNNSYMGVTETWNSLIDREIGSLSYCEISNNGTDGLNLDSYWLIDRCTIENNGGYGINGYNCFTIKSTIVRNNTQQVNLNNYITVTCSNIQGGYTGTGNIDEDPLYVDAANHDYHLSVQSPCIDTGDPESQLDPDITVADMGCYYFHHEYDIKEFTPGHIHWISFPRLTEQGTSGGNLYEHAYYANNMPGLLQDTAGGAPTIDGFEILYGLRNLNNINISYGILGFNENGFGNMLFCHEGYKLQTSNSANNTTLIVDGPRLTEYSWNLTANSSYWMGYYIPYPQNIENAFGDFWQYVNKVWAEEWYYDRLNSGRGDKGTTPANSTTGKTLEYGKMYIVEMSSSITDFDWNGSSASEIPIEKATTQSFSYTEEADYEAIDVLDIPAGVTEIGVFEGDTCVGAVVVDETDEQILAYTTQANRNPEPLEFQYVTGRGSTVVISSYLVWDNRLNDFVSGEIMPGRHGYSIVKFGEAVQPQTNPAPSLSGCSCYPNPFNPSTRIAFTLAVQQPVKVEVFNLKGQKVKTLSIGTLNAGAHNLVWNGTDEQGNPAASGLYFYRIKTNEQDISGKMLLMK